MSNTFICDLIDKDRAGHSFAPFAAIYQQLYFSFYENTLTLYQDQYPLFGDAQVMPVKVIWDYTVLLGAAGAAVLRAAADVGGPAGPPARCVRAGPRVEPRTAALDARVVRSATRRRCGPIAASSTSGRSAGSMK
jgi:hypothetical protein